MTVFPPQGARIMVYLFPLLPLSFNVIYLYYFHFLTTVKSAVKNESANIFFKILILDLLDPHPEVELVDNILVPF